MRKKIILLFSILIVLFLILSTTITKIYNKEVKIDNGLLFVSENMNNVKKVAKWYYPFAVSDSTIFSFSKANLSRLEIPNQSITIEKGSPFKVWYRVNKNDKTRLFEFSIIPDSGNSCRVKLSYESTLWGKLFGQDEITSHAIKSLESFNEYFSDTKKMYGYEIEITPVQDTAFLFYSTIVSNSEKRIGTKKLFETLIEYGVQNNAGYNGTRIFYYDSADKDSTHLFAGISITNTTAFNSWTNKKIVLKRMPYKNKLLVAYYQGAFSNLPNAYLKLEEYKKDHGFTGVALPFTKFLTEGYDFSEGQVIQAIVCYPIL